MLEKFRIFKQFKIVEVVCTILKNLQPYYSKKKKDFNKPNSWKAQKFQYLEFQIIWIVKQFNTWNTLKLKIVRKGLNSSNNLDKLNILNSLQKLTWW